MRTRYQDKATASISAQGTLDAVEYELGLAIDHFRRRVLNNFGASWGSGARLGRLQPRTRLVLALVLPVNTFCR
jgi:hypothetical protein